MFIEDAFAVAMLRESSQVVYEYWLGRISSAKASGESELLSAAKAYQKSIYADSEYAARHRTNAEFVQDVFASHLFREPTEGELTYWVSYIQNLPPSTPTLKRRSRLLDQFHTTIEFRDVVLGIVDPL